MKEQCDKQQNNFLTFFLTEFLSAQTCTVYDHLLLNGELKKCS